ncbi:hypothetical protein HZA87_00065 [Candidatus Uhrbacteria bacterium]|nr:hypothetical protein [Candidatus Uhrbacteria bacterium]
MELAILAQNMDSLTLAIVENHKIVRERVACILPEQYLKTIHETMHRWEVPLGELTGVLVVTGPGSFTASRVSTTIANAIAFARSLPIRGIENPKRLSLKELLYSMPIQDPAAFALPTYNRPPNITKPRLADVGISP